MAQKNVTRDMTQGSPLKLILTFSLPLLGGFLFQQLYSFMDTMVVGGVLGTEALAAVGDTGSLNFLINGFCMGICSGFAIPIAQAFGAKDETEMRRYVMHSVYLCAVISVLMGLLTGFFAPQLLRMLNTPEDILPLSVAYIQPVFFAIPVTVLYNMCGGVMRSLGDSKTPVIAITIAALLNIVLDYTFILAFHMGRGGCGMGDRHQPAHQRPLVSAGYPQAIHHPQNAGGGQAHPCSVCPPPAGNGYPVRSAVFHHGDWLSDGDICR